MHPEHRQIAEQHVADGATADAGGGAQQSKPEDVHLLARGDQGACCGKHGNSKPVEELDKRRHVPTCP